MNKFISHSLAFLGGALIVGLSAWFVAGKASELFIFEGSITNQKMYLATLKLLRNNELDKALNLLELNACVYYQLDPKLKDPESEEQTKNYFQDNYQRGNSPCSQVPNLRSGH